VEFLTNCRTAVLLPMQPTTPSTNWSRKACVLKYESTKVDKSMKEKDRVVKNLNLFLDVVSCYRYFYTTPCFFENEP
jgi:hypothetical protein